jgi:hypothetical protein
MSEANKKTESTAPVPIVEVPEQTKESGSSNPSASNAVDLRALFNKVADKNNCNFTPEEGELLSKVFKRFGEKGKAKPEDNSKDT